MSQPDLHIPAFRYDLAIEKLYGNPPEWSEPTKGISEIRLAIRYKVENSLLKHVSPVNTLFLDIIDYPGEWLLDLPLLELNFEAWSQQIAKLCDKEPRLTLSQPWREFIATFDLSEPANDTILRQASALYTEFLYQCKSPQYGLSLLQPGHFTMPGELKGAPILEFCPVFSLPSGEIKENSFYAVMKKRYEALYRAFFKF